MNIIASEIVQMTKIMDARAAQIADLTKRLDAAERDSHDIRNRCQIAESRLMFAEKRLEKIKAALEEDLDYGLLGSKIAEILNVEAPDGKV